MNISSLWTLTIIFLILLPKLAISQDEQRPITIDDIMALKSVGAPEISPDGQWVDGAKKGIKLFEVTREKKMVWKYEGHRAHHFQILTTNGKPIEGKPLK